MKQGIEQALLKVLKVAAEQNIIIKSISLPISWSNDHAELTPVEVLGVKVV